jgi:hypothetical protein
MFTILLCKGKPCGFSPKDDLNNKALIGKTNLRKAICFNKDF